MAKEHRIFRTARLSDKQIIELIDELASGFKTSDHNYYLTSERIVERTDIDAWIKNDPLARIISRAEFHLRPGKFHISIVRGISQSENDINTRIASPYFDEIVLIVPRSHQQGQTEPTTEELVSAIRIIEKHVQLLPFEGSASQTEPKDLLTAQIAGLSRLHEKLVSETVDLRARLENEKLDLKKDLEAELRAQRDALQSEHEKQRQEVETERKNLDEYRKSIDDRAYTFARREDRARITETISARLSTPGLSDTTLDQRKNVHRLLGALFSILVVAALFTGYELSTIDETSSKFWVTLARLSILSSASVGVAVYAIQWARKIYFEDARVERELERYSYDLNRASWIIETILEAKKENGGIPSETWIIGVCNNLFGGSQKKESEDSALEAFSDLLRVAAKAHVGTDGASLEFSNAGTKKIANSDK